jgi:hypothetical protein
MNGSHAPFQRSKSAERENRACPRFPAHVKTYCQSIKGEDDSFWSAQVAELSRKGAKVITHRRFEPGTVLRIGFIREKAGVLMARAIRVSPGPEDDWVIGCAFPKKLEEDEFRSWIDSNAK